MTKVVSRRRMLRRVLPLGFLAGVFVAVFCYLRVGGRDELDLAIADADRLDPGWRLEELQARRKVLPDKQNSALVALAAQDLRTRVGFTQRGVELFQRYYWRDAEPNVQFTRSRTAACRHE